MYISGSFENVSPTEVLSLLSLPTMTGALDVVDATGVLSLFVTEGKLCGVESETVPDLGSLLVARGDLDPDQWEGAVATTDDHQGRVALLVARGLVGRAELRGAVRSQLVLALAVVVAKSSGHFEFRNGAASALSGSEGHDVVDLLAEVGSRSGPSSALPSAAVVRTLVEPPATLEEVRLSRAEWGVVVTTGTGRELGAMATMLEQPVAALARLVEGLARRGLLSIVVPATAAAPVLVGAGAGAGAGLGPRALSPSITEPQRTPSVLSTMPSAPAFAPLARTTPSPAAPAPSAAAMSTMVPPPSSLTTPPLSPPEEQAATPPDELDSEWLDRTFGPPSAEVPVRTAPPSPPPGAERRSASGPAPAGPGPAPAAPPPTRGTSERAGFAAVLRELSLDVGEIADPGATPRSHAAGPSARAAEPEAEKKGFFGRKRG